MAPRHTVLSNVPARVYVLSYLARRSRRETQAGIMNWVQYIAEDWGARSLRQLAWLLQTRRSVWLSIKPLKIIDRSRGASVRWCRTIAAEILSHNLITKMASLFRHLPSSSLPLRCMRFSVVVICYREKPVMLVTDANFRPPYMHGRQIDLWPCTTFRPQKWKYAVNAWK